MSDQKDLGIIIAVLKRFEKQRLPHIFCIREYIERGEKLKDSDIDFLNDIIYETQKMASQTNKILKKHPEFEQLEINIRALYHYIAELSLINEKSSQPD